jgi:FecR protein
MLISSRVSSETGDKQLARVKGVVGYQTSATSDFKPIFGRLDLPDDAFAVTKPNGSAVLRLKDSSEIDIGENTKVQVGQFNAAGAGQNTIVLNGGALHFNIRHPQGGQSNYKFVTATSQIAVRGTEGFLIAGANGTQVVCVSCAAGDVSVQVGQQTVSIVTNQTLTVLGTNPLSATTSITTNPSINNPAVNQFSQNQNPFTTNATTTSLDPTGSLSGTGTGAVGGIGGVATAVGAAAGTAAVVATVAKPGTSEPSPSPQPSNAPPLVGTLVVQVNFPGATNFPQAFSWPFNQVNATNNATFSCGPANIITCTPQQQVSNGVLNGILTGNLLSAGAFTIAGSANGYTLSPTTFNVYGAVTPSPTSITFNSALPASQTVVVTQAGATNITASVVCPGGTNAANVTLSGASGSSPLTMTVTATSSPNAPVGQAPAVACTITVHGQGDGTASSFLIPVNVTTTAINVQSHRRKTN